MFVCLFVFFNQLKKKKDIFTRMYCGPGFKGTARTSQKAFVSAGIAVSHLSLRSEKEKAKKTKRLFVRL